MAKLFDIHIRTPREGVATILEVLNGAADLVSITQVADEAAKPRTRISHKRGGLTGEKLILEFLAGLQPGTKFGLSKIGKLFAARGFQEHSASAAMSKLSTEAKVVRRLGGGFYERV